MCRLDINERLHSGEYFKRMRFLLPNWHSLWNSGIDKWYYLWYEEKEVVLEVVSKYLSFGYHTGIDNWSTYHYIPIIMLFAVWAILTLTTVHGASLFEKYYVSRSITILYCRLPKILTFQFEQIRNTVNAIKSIF